MAVVTSKIPVGMVHPVNAPQDGDFVGQQMRPPDGKVQNHNAYQNGNP